MASTYICSGNLTQDSMLRDVGTSKVLNFSVAVNVGFGEKTATHYVDCAIWGKRGEALKNSLVTATPVIVGGELKVEKFQKKDGSQGTAMRLAVDSFDFQKGSKPNGSQQKANPQTMGGASDLQDVSDDFPELE